LSRSLQLTVSGLAAKMAEESGVTPEEAAAQIWERAKRGEIKLVDPHPPKSFPSYLLSFNSAWYWLVFAGLVTMFASIYLLPQAPPFTWLRVLMGFLVSLYLPGYALIEALYPQRSELEELERLALSVGLSLALTPLTGFVLNYTPWGIRLDPITVAITFLILALGLVAVFRKYQYHVLALQRLE
jgi:uncharacterized membrane protein